MQYRYRIDVKVDGEWRLYDYKDSRKVAVVRARQASELISEQQRKNGLLRVCCVDEDGRGTCQGEILNGHIIRTTYHVGDDTCPQCLGCGTFANKTCSRCNELGYIK